MDFSGKRILTRSAQGLTLGALVASTVAFVGADKSVALTVDGKTQKVHTYGNTVEDVLRSASVEVTGADEVSAPLDAKVSTGSKVRVKLAREVSVNVDGAERKVNTTADTVGDLTEQLGLASDAQVSLGSEVQLASSTSLTVVTPKHVRLDLGGKIKHVSTTGTDVADVLKENGIAPDQDDIVSPAPNTVLTDGASVTWQKVEVKKETTTSTLAAGSITVKTDVLDRGKTKTVRAGKAGQRTTETSVRYINGKVVSRDVISSKITQAPVAKLVQVGTTDPDQGKDAEASESGADSKPSDSNSSDSAASKAKESKPAPSGSVSGVWQKLAQCESGGNWSTNTGNGYYGGLQFTASTWKAQGGTKYAALPHQASAAEQVAVASKLQKKAGWGQWPACTSKLGLR